MDLWNCRSKLKGSQIFLQEDFPAEIEQRRRKLYPIYKEAKKTRNNIFLVADKLIIDGMRYTTENLENLPGDLQLKYLATRISDKTVMFY